MKAARSSSVLALFLVSVWIAAAEIARLISETLSSSGQSYSIDDTIGPLAVTGTEAWAAWATADTPSS
jgi:hypothetical protein